MSANLLGEALQSAETATTVDATPDPAQVEETPVTDPNATDSSLQTTDESVVEQEKETVEPPKEEVQPSKAELDFKELRTQKETLESELSQTREKFQQFGGESQLQIMAPVLQKAQELPSSPEGMEKWSGEMWDAVSKSLVPAQVSSLKTEAAWNYLRDPASQKVISEELYGEGITPQILQNLVAIYREEPGILNDPNEAPEQRTAREAFEARERDRDAQLKTITEENEKRNAEAVATQAREIMTGQGGVLQTGLAPRFEVKKQYGLEFQKSDKDTPEIASFKERAAKKYDEITLLRLQADSEMNRLSNAAEYLAKQKDEGQRKRAHDQYTPLIEARTRAVCAQVAKDLAEDLKLFDPKYSDRAKADNLKDLPAQVLGGTPGNTTSAGIDFSNMPDPASDPRGYENWVAKITAERMQGQRTPGVLAAG